MISLLDRLTPQQFLELKSRINRIEAEGLMTSTGKTQVFLINVMGVDPDLDIDDDEKKERKNLL